MALSTGREVAQKSTDVHTIYHSMFPAHGMLETTEQIRRFELLRLAFFALKLRKIEQRLSVEPAKAEGKENTTTQQSEQHFHRNLLRHVIFQQVLTLIHLDAREQALQIIEACQK